MKGLNCFIYLFVCLNLGFSLVCDSQRKQSPPSFPGNDQEASQLEQEYVHRVYEEIAGHFSSTRHTPWPHIVQFLKSLPNGSIVADIGCGNGKYLGINQELYMASNVVPTLVLLYLQWLLFFFLMILCFLFVCF